MPATVPRDADLRSGGALTGSARDPSTSVEPLNLGHADPMQHNEIF